MYACTPATGCDYAASELSRRTGREAMQVDASQLKLLMQHTTALARQSMLLTSSSACQPQAQIEPLQGSKQSTHTAWPLLLHRNTLQQPAVLAVTASVFSNTYMYTC